MIDPIPLNAETERLARRMIWFEPPSKALSDPTRFAAYAFAYATFEDMQVLRRYMPDDALREALKNAPPGIIDARSWAYWHLRLDAGPAPPLPVRSFG